MDISFNHLRLETNRVKVKVALIKICEVSNSIICLRSLGFGTLVSTICEVWLLVTACDTDTHLVIVRVRVLLPAYRRPQEHLPPPAEAAGTQSHVGEAEPEAESHRQSEHGVAWHHRVVTWTWTIHHQASLNDFHRELCDVKSYDAGCSHLWGGAGHLHFCCQSLSVFSNYIPVI